MTRTLVPALAMLLATTAPSLSAGNDLAVSLRNQIVQCWNPPVGTPHPAPPPVSFRLLLNPDGTVAQAPQLIGSTSDDGPSVRVAEDAARRAIYSCAPYKLPKDRYEEWHDVVFTFDTSLMMRQ